MTTTENGQRDELAKIIDRAEHYYDAGTRHEFVAMEAAEAILNEGYRKPRTITTVEDAARVLELPPLSLVLSAGKPFIMQHEGLLLDYDGISHDVWEMEYPLTVIHEPEAEVGA